jgi:hypothetical protein
MAAPCFGGNCPCVPLPQFRFLRRDERLRQKNHDALVPLQQLYSSSSGSNDSGILPMCC